MRRIDPPYARFAIAWTLFKPQPANFDLSDRAWGPARTTVGVVGVYLYTIAAQVGAVSTNPSKMVTADLRMCRAKAGAQYSSVICEAWPPR